MNSSPNIGVAVDIQPTPLVSLESVGADLYGKLEYVHPTRSAKYRALVPHLNAIAAAGEMDKTARIVIRSAGCAAETVAWWCRAQGRTAEAVIPKYAEPEVVAELMSLDAVIHQFDPDQAAAFMKQADADPGAFVVDQFGDDRIIPHYRPMAAEILDKLPDVAAIVVGIGTAASIMGVAQEIHGTQSRVKVIGVWPEEFDPSWKTPFRKHGIIGLAPPVRENHLVRDQVDDIIQVPSDAAVVRAHQCFQSCGLPVGSSSGATLEAAIRMRQGGFEGHIACIFASMAAAHLPDPE